jgi:hypothetical protein
MILPAGNDLPGSGFRSEQQDDAKAEKQDRALDFF